MWRRPATSRGPGSRGVGRSRDRPPHIIFFHFDGGAVAQHFRHSLHHFRRVVAHAHDRVRALLRRVGEHTVERVFPRLFAEFRKERNVPAYDRLQTRPDRAQHRAGPHDDPPHDPEVGRHLVPGKLKSRRRHLVWNHCLSSRTCHRNSTTDNLLRPPSPPENDEKNHEPYPATRANAFTAPDRARKIRARKFRVSARAFPVQ